MAISVKQDIAYALRRASRAPAFTAVVVLTLALGIGASAAVFTFLDATILKSLPYREPERLMAIWESSPERNLLQFSVSPVNLADWQSRSREFAGFVSTRASRFILQTKGDPERILGASVSTNFFSLLGVPVALGHPFTVADSTGAAGRVAVISQSLWRRQFGSERSVIGKPINLNGVPYEVIGVLGDGLPGKAEVYVPLTLPPTFMADRGAHYISVIGRIANGRTRATAERELKGIAAQLATEYSATNLNWTVATVPILDQILGTTKPAVIALMVAVLFVLLIACANVANLLLARGISREGEIAVRTAMGAQRIHLVRQLLVESFVLAIASAFIGVFVAWMGVAALRSLAPANLPRLDQVGLDARFSWFVAAITAGTATLFGLPPALHASIADVAQRLRGAGRGSGSGRRGGLIQRSLVVVQIAVALSLLTGSSLLLRAFVQLRTQDLGLNSEKVLSAQLSLPRAAFPRDADQARFASELMDHLSPRPGVVSATMVDVVPVGAGMNFLLFNIQGQPVTDPSNGPVANVLSIAPDYFKTLAIPIASGRDFTRNDRADSPRVVIIDDLLAKRYFAGQNPIGKRLMLGDTVPREIVAVVGHVHQAGPDAKDNAMMYTPMAQQPSTQFTVLVKLAGDAGSIAKLIRGEIRAINPSVPVYDIQTLDERIDASIASTRFNATIALIFAGVALLLAAIGVYSMLAFMVAQQTREFGVRAALGAPRTSLMGAVIGRGLMLGAMGVVGGVALSLGAVRGLRSFVGGVGQIEPLVLTGTSVVFIIIAVAAAFIPALRATRVSPLEALRAD
ncbi:MAG: ABC transporter permease [Gemmatimonadaceae bacterium]